MQPFLLLCLLVSICAATKATKPNILFIITDDQDSHMDSVKHMPLLQKYMVEEGTVFENHFCTIGSILKNLDVSYTHI